MLRDALFLARQDLRIMFRSKETWLWIFLMPLLFFYFLGTVTGGFGHSNPEPDKIAITVAPDAGFLADHLALRLAQRQYRVVRPAARELASYTRRLEIPARFTEDVLAGRPVELAFTRQGGGLGADYDGVKLRRAVFTVLADVMAGAQPPTAQSVAAIAALPQTLTVRTTAVGRHLQAPTGFQQAIPGTMVMFTLLVMFTSGAVTLTSERNHGLLRRLAASPMRRGAVVAGKWTARLTLGLIQIGFAMLIAPVLFPMSWGPNVGAIVMVQLAYAALITGLGMLLGNEGRTEAQVIGMGVMASNLIAAIGGCWWPIEVAPPWAQKAALFLPTGWAMDAMHKLVSFGAPASSVIPHVAGMLLGAVALGYVVARRFRFQ